MLARMVLVILSRLGCCFAIRLSTEGVIALVWDAQEAGQAEEAFKICVDALTYLQVCRQTTPFPFPPSSPLPLLSSLPPSLPRSLPPNSPSLAHEFGHIVSEYRQLAISPAGYRWLAASSIGYHWLATLSLGLAVAWFLSVGNCRLAINYIVGRHRL